MTRARDLADIADLDITGTVTADGLTVDGDASLDGTAVNFIFNETDTTDLNTRLRQSGALFSVATVNDSGSSPKAHIVVNNSLGDISFYDNTGTTQGFYWDASTQRLGLGTTSPDEGLHVEESTTGTAVRIARGGNYIDIGGSGSGTQYVKGFEGSVAFGNVYAGNTLFLTGDTERMRIDGNGNVGIGTTSPDRSLHIAGTEPSVVLENTGQGTDLKTWRIYSNSSSLQVGTVDDAFSAGQNALEITRNNTDNITGILFKTGASSEAMRIDSSGNITATSEGGTANKIDLRQGSAKVWFDIANSSTISDSFNVTSNTDNGTGSHTVTINNNMDSADYSVGGMAQEDTGGGPRIFSGDGTAASGTRKFFTGTSSEARDCLHSNGIISGDLA